MAGNRFRQVIEVVMKGAGKASSDSKKVQKGLQGVAKDAAKIGAAFYAAKGGINATKNFVGNAMGVERITPAFESLRKEMGFSANTMNSLNDAVNGTVKQTELMTMANQAMTLGVVDSEKGMAELFDIAQRLGKSLGVDVKSSIDSLVTGMGRQSIMMLDNLGIIVDTQKAYDNYAKQLGKTSSELTDQEKKTAFNNAALEAAKEKVKALGSENLDTADSFSQLERATSDFSAGIGKALLPILERGARGVTNLLEGLNKLFGFDSDSKSKASDKQLYLYEKEVDLINEMADGDEKRNRLAKIYHDNLTKLKTMTIQSHKYKVTAIDDKDLATVQQYNKAIELQKPLLDEVGKAKARAKARDAIDLKILNTEVTHAQTHELNKREGFLKTHLARLNNYVENNVNYTIKLNKGILKAELTDDQRRQRIEDARDARKARRNKFDNEYLETLTKINIVEESLLGIGEQKVEAIESENEHRDSQRTAVEDLAFSHMVLKDVMAAGDEQALIGIALGDVMKNSWKVQKEELDKFTHSHVGSAMAIGAAQLHVGQATADAAGAFILAKTQEAIASFIADAFKNFGILGGIVGAGAAGAVGSLMSGAIQSVAAAEGMNEVVTEPTLILAGEEGAEYVNIEPTQNQGAGMGGGQIIFQGNVLSKDFIEDEAIPMIRDAVRRGHSLA